jgi:hypothetical protein
MIDDVEVPPRAMTAGRSRRGGLRGWILRELFRTVALCSVWFYQGWIYRGIHDSHDRLEAWEEIKTRSDQVDELRRALEGELELLDGGGDNAA